MNVILFEGLNCMVKVQEVSIVLSPVASLTATALGMTNISTIDEKGDSLHYHQ